MSYVDAFSDNGFADVPLIAKNGGMLIAARVFYLKQVPIHPLTNTSLSPSLLRLGLSIIYTNKRMVT
jgi:hypothetical protein